MSWEGCRMKLSLSILKYSTCSDKLKHTSHLLTPGHSCMTQCQTVLHFPDVNQVLLYKSNKFNLPVF